MYIAMVFHPGLESSVKLPFAQYTTNVLRDLYKKSIKRCDNQSSGLLVRHVGYQMAYQAPRKIIKCLKWLAPVRNCLDTVVTFIIYGTHVHSII